MCFVTRWKGNAVYFLPYWSVNQNLTLSLFRTHILSPYTFSLYAYFSLLSIRVYIFFYPGLVVITHLLSCGFLQVGKCSTIYFWFWLKTWIFDKVSFLAERECNILYTALNPRLAICLYSLSFQQSNICALQNNCSLYHPTRMWEIFCHLYRTWLKYEFIKKKYST